MASFDIHLAIGMRYISKNNIINKNDLLKGVIDPDLSDNKNISHYRIDINSNTLSLYLSAKVNLLEFLNKNDINDEYNKGIFLHLITDYLFFNDFFDKNYINNISYQDFINDLYYTYDKYNNYLENKYCINDYLKMENLTSYIEKAKKTNKYFKGDYKLIFNEDTISNFIDRVSNINLEKYKNKILENNRNVLP